MQSCMASKYI